MQQTMAALSLSSHDQEEMLTWIADLLYMSAAALFCSRHRQR